jgi:transcriptional antiterminator Rof (Rho-off)
MNTDRTASDYQPISCASYDECEIAIMQRQKMHLAWREGNALFDEIVTPLNLRTIGGEEFLILRTANGATREVRLDRISRAEPA